MSFWPQRLTFAVWCATTGCGISRDILFSSGSIRDLSTQLRSFYLFHVYFTVRRILYEMGGIHSTSPLPDDPTFNQKDNHYDVSSYKRICVEFGVDPSADFRFTHGKNSGLGNVYIWVSYSRPSSTDYNYPGDPDLARFTDKGGGKELANDIYFVRNDQGADRQFEYFVPDYAQGLTQAGLARINQTIEAFAYCVLGAQVNVRRSILGNGGRAKEAQSEFLVLMEDAIRTPDISKNVQRYQLAIDEAKVRLDFATSPGTWLMPSRMVINNESTIGYNNQLKQATPGMKLGGNNDKKFRHKKGFTTANRRRA